MTAITINGIQQPNVEQGTVMTVQATVNDRLFSSRNGTEPRQNIAATSFYIDALPWQQGATANSMAAIDGILGSSIEDMQGTFNTANLALGRHTVYVHGQDANGYWGVVSAMDFTVVEVGEPPANLSPEAHFSVACSGRHCQFDASASHDSDGTIAQYRWLLGDGSNEVMTSSPLYEHHFIPGDYTVGLTVVDNLGAQDSWTESIDVVNLVPNASFVSHCEQGECVFDGSASTDTDGSIDSYLWQVDGQALAGNEAQISHQFTESGQFEVSLTVSDDSGASATSGETLEVTVSDATPAPTPTPTPTPTTNTSASGGGGSFSWFVMLGLLVVRIRCGYRSC